MGGDDMGNLIPINERTKDEQREITQKGGKASGKSRRQRKAIREQLDELLSLPVKDKETRDELRKMGLRDPDNNALVTVALFKQATAGNVKAIEMITKMFEMTEYERTKLDYLALRIEAQLKLHEPPEADSNLIEALTDTAAEVWADYTEDIPDD
jgi:hypothetical protein